MRRVFFALPVLLLIGGAVFFGVAPGMVERSMNEIRPGHTVAVADTARQLHAQLFVADLHADLLMWHRDPLDRGRRGHTDVPRLVEGNVALQVFSAVTKSPRGLNYDRNSADTDNITLLALAQRWPTATWTSRTARALHQARRLHEAARQSDGQLVVIRSVADLDAFVQRRAAEPRLLAGLLAIEGLHALDGRLAHLDTLYAAGYRMMGLAHFFDNEVAGSAHGMAKGGLTPLGRQVVARMEALHLLVDLAHASPQTIDEVLAMATRPVVVSHTGVQATCPGPRNLTDDQVRRIAATGGVMGIGYWDGAVCAADARATARAIRHVANLVGVAHVALGSDFDGAVTTAFDATGLAQVTQALLDEGFSRDEVAQVMGGNVLRLLQATLPPG
jgi:microsomal dipeptidase-like Zn-dependent dipeptidase